MWCGLNALGTKQEQKTSKEIDDALRDVNKTLKYETKILLLGTGESGKSTILKQLRIIYKNGFPEDELQTYKPIVHANMISAMWTLCKHMLSEGEFEGMEESIKEQAKFMSKPEIRIACVCTPEIVEAIGSLWALRAVKTRWENRSDLQISDAAAFFFDNLERITKSDYLPTYEDVLQTRVRTVGINEISFKLAGAALRIVDVGGQRSERRKWIHCFEDVTVIFFIVALSEYDQVLVEDESTNRLEEALNLFEEIVNCSWFSQTPLILFLNKKDLFELKLKRSPLSKFFSDWSGKDDPVSAAKFIEEKFKTRNRNSSRTLYTHVTCATDTQNVLFVFKAFQEIFLNMRLAGSGLPV